MAACHFVGQTFQESRVKIRLITLKLNLRNSRRQIGGKFSSGVSRFASEAICDG